MKRIAVNLTSSLLTFAIGLTAASFWNWDKYPLRNGQSSVNVSRDVRQINDSSAVTVIPLPAATSDREVFGRGRLRIVPDEVQLKSERLRYEIDVRFPQIVGSEHLHIRKLNQHLKDLATEQHHWPLNPSKTDLQYYREKWPDVFNSVDLDYEIRLASDSLLSIYFVGYSYGIGAAHSVQYSFVINYDLVLRKQLKLSDLFKRHSKYLEFISGYCMDELSKGPEEASDDFMFKEALAPIGENYDSWNFTRDGIRFNFDACKVFSCAEGKQEVEIPFAALKQWLNPDTSVYLLAIPTRSIKEVDFKNFTYPWYPSGYKTPYNVKKVTLDNGEHLVDERGDISGILFVLTNVSYADLTSDGFEEAIVTVTGIFNPNGSYACVFIYSPKGNFPQLLWKHETGDRAYGGLRSIRVAESNLIVEQYDTGNEEPCMICAKGFVRSYYQWNGKSLRKLKSEIFPWEGGVMFLGYPSDAV